MRRLLFAAALVVTSTSALAADVGISVSVGQPGFYGRLDIGDFPQPQVIHRRPIAVQAVPTDRPPIYLRVPPDHAKHWKKNCHKYDACGERVYFVRDNWYQREYAPRYQERHDDRRDDRHDESRDDQRGDQGNDRPDGKHGHGRNK